MPPRRESDNIILARKIISGLEADYQTLLSLADRLKSERAFGYARRMLERARTKPEAREPNNHLLLAQKLALVTYQDVDLLPDQRFDRALKVLQEGDDL